MVCSLEGEHASLSISLSHVISYLRYSHTLTELSSTQSMSIRGVAWII